MSSARTWTAAACAALVAVLLCSPSAFAVRSGGHNPPTRKLEAAFKVAGGKRAGSEDGCYPAPHRLAAAIRRWAHPDADVAADLGSVRRQDVVYVLSRSARCDRVRFALRNRGRLFLLDTAGGEIYLQGQRDRLGEESRRGGRGPLRALTLVAKSFVLDRPDKARRLVARCPKGRFPLGGGVASTPSLSADGEGVYPHSYERIGVQRGYHVTALVIDPTPGSTVPREVALQVVCGRGLVPKSSPHRTVFVRRNESNIAVARCPRGQYVFSGGFQRTNFTTPFLTLGGNFVTESRAIGPQAWQVSGRAVGEDGGELTAIAYCARNDGPMFTEVSASTSVPSGGSATATTPGCPPGFELAAGGFSFGGSQDALFADGAINPDGTWSATGFGYFGPVPDLTAYGYCLQVSDAD